jgi:hypothetical protein
VQSVVLTRVSFAGGVMTNVLCWRHARAYVIAVNVKGTENLIQACRLNNVTQLVYTSTSSVVNDGSDIQNGDENLPYPKSHLDYYSATKAEAERIVIAANGLPNGTHLPPFPTRTHAVSGGTNVVVAGIVVCMSACACLNECVRVNAYVFSLGQTLVHLLTASPCIVWTTRCALYCTADCQGSHR